MCDVPIQNTMLMHRYQLFCGFSLSYFIKDQSIKNAFFLCILLISLSEMHSYLR